MAQEIILNGNVCNGITFRSESAAQLYARTIREEEPIQVTINIHTQSKQKNFVHQEAINCLSEGTAFILYQDRLNYTMVNPSFMAIRQIKNGKIYNDQVSERDGFLNSVKMLIMGYENIVVGKDALDFQKNILQTIEKIL